MYCANCGTKLSEIHNFCNSCGAKAKGIINQQPDEHDLNLKPIDSTDMATFGVLTVQDQSLILKGKVYIAALRKKTINQTFQIDEVTVSTGTLRGVFSKKGMLLLIPIIIIGFFITNILDSYNHYLFEERSNLVSFLMEIVLFMPIYVPIFYILFKHTLKGAISKINVIPLICISGVYLLLYFYLKKSVNFEYLYPYNSFLRLTFTYILKLPLYFLIYFILSTDKIRRIISKKWSIFRDVIIGIYVIQLFLSVYIVNLYSGNAPVIPYLVLWTLFNILIYILLVKKKNVLSITFGNESFFVPLYNYFKPVQHKLLKALSNNGIPIDGLISIDKLQYKFLSEKDRKSSSFISKTSLISGFILLGYAVGYLLPWFKSISGVDVLHGLGKASSIANGAVDILGIGGGTAESISTLYYMTIGTIIISIIAGVVALAMRSKGSVVLVFLASLFDLYFLIDIANKISDISKFIPVSNSSLYVGVGFDNVGVGFYVIILAVVISTIFSFISLFSRNPQPLHSKQIRD